MKTTITTNPEIAGIADKAMDCLNLRITDLVFQTIQEDRTLTHAFMTAVGNHGWQAVCQTIGRRVEERYGLEKTPGKRNRHPSSVLARSHSELRFRSNKCTK